MGSGLPRTAVSHSNLPPWAIKDCRSTPPPSSSQPARRTLYFRKKKKKRLKKWRETCESPSKTTPPLTSLPCPPTPGPSNPHSPPTLSFSRRSKWRAHPKNQQLAKPGALGNVSPPPQLALVAPSPCLFRQDSRFPGAAPPSSGLLFPVAITLTSPFLPFQSSEVGQNCRYHPDEPRSDGSSPTEPAAGVDCEQIRWTRTSPTPTRTAILPSFCGARAPAPPPTTRRPPRPPPPATRGFQCHLTLLNLT